jgi:hypothetical protein
MYILFNLPHKYIYMYILFNLPHKYIYMYILFNLPLVCLCVTRWISCHKHVMHTTYIFIYLFCLCYSHSRPYLAICQWIFKMSNTTSRRVPLVEQELLTRQVDLWFFSRVCFAQSFVFSVLFLSVIVLYVLWIMSSDYPSSILITKRTYDAICKSECKMEKCLWKLNI